jgi:hypothetical protein
MHTGDDVYGRWADILDHDARLHREETAELNQRISDLEAANEKLRESCRLTNPAYSHAEIERDEAVAKVSEVGAHMASLLRRKNSAEAEAKLRIARLEAKLKTEGAR